MKITRTNSIVGMSDQGPGHGATLVHLTIIYKFFSIITLEWIYDFLECYKLTVGTLYLSAGSC